MQRSKLTNAAVEKFQCRPDRDNDVLWCGELKGFGMRLSVKTSVRTYFIQYRVKGAKQDTYITIGRHNDPYRVDQARAKALELKAQMIVGVNPVAEAKRKEAARVDQAQRDIAFNVTLRQMLEHYLEHKRTKHGPLRPATKDDMKRSIESNLTGWLDKPIATITRSVCLERFIELSKNAPSSANLTMVYLRSICNHAAHLHADEEGNFTILATNPVTRMFKIQRPNKEKPRTRRIPLNRVGHAWLSLNRLRATAKTTADRTRVDLVSLRFLTALRLTESGSLRWPQIDLASKVIRLSGDVGKTHQDMLLPMSTELHSLLEERSKLPRKSPNAREYVFPSPNESGKLPWMKDPNATMKVLSSAVGHTVSAHDFRRTIEDVAKAVKVDPDDRRKLLVHLAGDVHGTHYDNSPDPEALRPSVNAIARFITDAAFVAEAQENGSNVIAFPGMPANA